MNILQYSYKKRGKIEFVFEGWPHSKVTMVPIKGYYFVRFIKWSSQDPIVTRNDLEKWSGLRTNISAQPPSIENERHLKPHRPENRRWGFLADDAEKRRNIQSGRLRQKVG